MTTAGDRATSTDGRSGARNRRRAGVRRPAELADAEPLVPGLPPVWRKVLAGGLAVALVAVTAAPPRRRP